MTPIISNVQSAFSMNYNHLHRCILLTCLEYVFTITQFPLVDYVIKTKLNPPDKVRKRYWHIV